MAQLDEFFGWAKKVLGERSDGEHEWLDALYCCRSQVEAVTLQSCRQPTHVKRGDEVLLSRGGTVYQGENGDMFVVFDWRAPDAFIPLVTADSY